MTNVDKEKARIEVRRIVDMVKANGSIYGGCPGLQYQVSCIRPFDKMLAGLLERVMSAANEVDAYLKERCDR